MYQAQEQDDAGVTRPAVDSEETENDVRHQLRLIHPPLWGSWRRRAGPVWQCGVELLIGSVYVATGPFYRSRK